MAAWSNWYEAVLLHAPGAARGLVDYETRRAAIELFERSLAWRASIADIASVDGTAEYTPPDPSSVLTVVRVMKVRWLGAKLEPKTPAQLDEIYGTVDWRELEGTPSYFTSEKPGTIRLVPIPDVSTAAAIDGMVAALAPTATAATIDDAWAKECFQEIANGARRNILRLPGKPYSNPALATAYGDLFESDVGSLAYRQSRGFGPSNNRVVTHFL